MEMTFENIDTTGLNPQRAERVRLVCFESGRSLLKHPQMGPLLERFFSERAGLLPHVEEVAFFATLIASNLDWGSKRILSTISSSAILHDLWALEATLPPETGALLLHSDDDPLYRAHPEKTYEIVSKSGLDVSVAQVIYQHHEFNNGTGFPNKLTRNRIYPLSKILSFTEDYLLACARENLSPKEGLKPYFKSTNHLELFDHDVIRSFLYLYAKDTHYTPPETQA